VRFAAQSCKLPPFCTLKRAHVLMALTPRHCCCSTCAQARQSKAARQGSSSSSSRSRQAAAPFVSFPLAPGELPDGAGTCAVKETLEQVRHTFAVLRAHWVKSLLLVCVCMSRTDAVHIAPVQSPDDAVCWLLLCSVAGREGCAS
jgi:hypothetical protein